MTFLVPNSRRLVPLGCYPNLGSTGCGDYQNTPASPCTFFVPGCRGEGAHVQCGVPVVRLNDRPGHEALLPVLVSVAEPWEVVGGRCHPAHLEPRGSRESGSAHLQPLTLCGIFHHASESHVGMSLMRLLGWSPTS